MTHREAIALLLGVDRAIARDRSTRTRSAVEHVARCSDCWTTLSRAHVVMTGVLPPEDLEMRRSYGCEDLQDRLSESMDLSLEEIRRHDAALADHVGWCSSCREGLADLQSFAATLAMENSTAVASSESSAQRAWTSTLRPRWSETLTAAGERLRQMTGEIALQMRRGLVDDVASPVGVEIRLIGEIAGVMRGTPGPGGTPARSFQLDLGDGEMRIELIIEPDRETRCRLGIQVLSGDRPIAIELIRVDKGTELLVAAQDAALSEPFVATNLVPANYHLEVRERRARVVHRIQLSLRRES